MQKNFIEYDDIKPYDVLLVTHKYPSGFETTNAGTAMQPYIINDEHTQWLTDTGLGMFSAIAYKQTNKGIEQTIELLERPGVTLPTVQGTYIRITKIASWRETATDINAIAVLDTDNQWSYFDAEQFENSVDAGEVLEWNLIEIIDIPKETK